MPTLFSRIIAGEIPGTFVYRDDLCVAFLSINPIADGHLLVVPIEEVDHWVDMSASLSQHLFAVCRTLSQALFRAFPCHKVGLVIAGYEINHCHIHLIPTESMADMDFSRAASHVERSVLELHAQRLTKVL